MKIVKRSSRAAYSLLEVSIVIAIAGFLLAAVAQSSKMVKESRRANAQTLTQNSPVNDIPNLALWLETSLPSSFIGSEIRPGDGSQISTWLDNNPQALEKNNSTQAILASQPKFYTETFNGVIGGIRFDGADDHMNFDGSMVVGTSYTVFVVEQRRIAKSTPYFFIAGSGDPISGDIVTNGSLTLGYLNNGNMTFGHYANDLNSSIDGYTRPTPAIHGFLFNSTKGKQYWLNGSNFDSDAAQTDPLVENPSASLGRFFTDYYDGDIAEVIIFTRALTNGERQSVENYLSKKYNIALS